MYQRHRFYFQLLVALTLLILGGWVYSSEHLREQRRTEHLENIASSLASRLSGTLNSSTLALYSLGELALQGDGQIQGLASMVDKMRLHNTSILNVAILPDGVVRQIAPLTGNSDALGHDMFQDANRIDGAVKARDSGTMTVTGPYTLIQGGEAVIARLPLYEDERFWGFVSIVYRFPELIGPMLARYQSHNLLLAMSQDEHNVPFLTNASQAMPDSIQQWIRLPNNRWLLHLAYRPAFNWILLAKLAGAALVTLLMSLLYQYIFQAIASNARLQALLVQGGNLRARQTDQHTMLARISHDLRAPMLHVLNEVRALARSDKDRQARKIEHSVRYQLSLVDQLLDYTGQPDREQGTATEPGYTYRFLRQLGEQAESLADTWDNRFVLHLAPDLPAIVQADFNQLQRVLINLLTNAAKFTRQGSVSLSVTRLSALGHNDRLRFRVKDNGPGMPDAASWGTHANSGYGLGLMIVTDLLRQMDSQLEYQPNDGGGADFHFDLELPQPTDTPAPYIERHALEWNGEHLSVLLADPDAAAAAQVEELLLGYGIDVQVCNSVECARKALRQTRVDLVITELEFPEGNGSSLLKTASILPTPVPVMLYASRMEQPSREFHFAVELLRPAGSDQLLMHIQQLTTHGMQQGSA